MFLINNYVQYIHTSKQLSNCMYSVTVGGWFSLRDLLWLEFVFAVLAQQISVHIIACRHLEGGQGMNVSQAHTHTNVCVVC